MKTLITYSTLTGNTQKIAEAIYENIQDEKEILPIKEVTNIEIYDRIIVGYWVDKGHANEEAKQFMLKISNKAVGIFGTLGADPDSEHAKDCMQKVAECVKQNNNTLIGEFICQGAIDPKLIEYMTSLDKDHPHAPTPERRARWKKASKHPNESDCLAAQKIFNF